MKTLVFLCVTISAAWVLPEVYFIHVMFNRIISQL